MYAVAALPLGQGNEIEVRQIGALHLLAGLVAKYCGKVHEPRKTR